MQINKAQSVHQPKQPETERKTKQQQTPKKFSCYCFLIQLLLILEKLMQVYVHGTTSSVETACTSPKFSKQSSNTY
jgi:hypothetical protein